MDVVSVEDRELARENERLRRENRILKDLSRTRTVDLVRLAHPWYDRSAACPDCPCGECGFSACARAAWLSSLRTDKPHLPTPGPGVALHQQMIHCGPVAV